MKGAVQFLMHIYDRSVVDIANILTAQADNDKGRIIEYLEHVKEYTKELIEKVKNNE